MKTRRDTFVGITLPLVVLLSSAVSIGGPVSHPPDQREIKITASRFEFRPKTITVSIGERVRLVVSSEDVDRGFAIKEFDIDQAIKAKQTKVIEVTPNKEGRFRFSCSVLCGDGHPEMVGELIVTGAPAEASRMNVTFDPTSRSVVIVESAGERLRIVTSNNTVERIFELATASAQKPAKEPAEPALKQRAREQQRLRALVLCPTRSL